MDTEYFGEEREPNSKQLTQSLLRLIYRTIAGLPDTKEKASSIVGDGGKDPRKMLMPQVSFFLQWSPD